MEVVNIGQNISLPKAYQAGHAHNRLEYSSILFSTPYDVITITQMLVNTGFFQRKLGIRAGFCKRSCLFSHSTNSGTVQRVMIDKVKFAGSFTFDMPLVNVLTSSLIRIYQTILPSGKRTQEYRRRTLIPNRPTMHQSNRFRPGVYEGFHVPFLGHLVVPIVPLGIGVASILLKSNNRTSSQ